jgi:succinoglycan biosynthesis transport protein ExoP
LNGASDPRAADAVFDWPTSQFAQGLIPLLQRVRQASSNQGAAVVTVTALEAGSAKTSVAVALARAASQAQLRVAVIDADLNRPAAARAMGLGPQRSGLIELLSGRAPLANAFVRDARSNALVISPVQPSRDPFAVLASAKMADLIAHLRRSCDLVIFNAPPLAASRELQALGRLSDSVLVVTREETLAHRAGPLEAFAASRTASTGVVLVR